MALQPPRLKRKKSEDMINLTLRIPSELYLELPYVAAFMYTKDSSELVRTWIREHMTRILASKQYQAFKERKKEEERQTIESA